MSLCKEHTPHTTMILTLNHPTVIFKMDNIVTSITSITNLYIVVKKSEENRGMGQTFGNSKKKSFEPSKGSHTGQKVYEG